MDHEELRFLADTELIDRVLLIDAGLRKDAGVISDSLGSIGSAVQRYVVSNIDTSSGAGLIKSVLRLLEPSIFFSIHPILGILDTAAQAMGFSLTDIISSIVDTIRPKIEKGERISPSDINAAGKTLLAGAGMEAESSVDFFADLRRMDQEKQFVKIALSPVRDIKQFYNQPLLYRIFGFLGRRRGRGLLVGFIVWFIKSILLSAGLLAVGGTVHDLLSKKEEKPGQSMPGGFTPPTQEESIPTTTPVSREPAPLPKSAPPPVGLAPSGRGEQTFKNDENNVWVVPVYGNVPNTLILWATEIYPDLKGHEDLFENSASFNRVANILGSYMDYRSPNYLVMPPGFNRRIDVVNLFAGDVARRLPPKQEGRNEQSV